MERTPMPNLPEVDTKKLHSKANKLVTIIDGQLREMPNFNDENDVALLAILTRSLVTFKVILKLLKFSHTGSACMVLARTLIESMVGVMFIRLKGTDKMLERFRLFETAEAKHDIEYLKSKGIDISQLDPDKVNREYEKHKKIFERKPDDIWDSWAHTNFEGMVDELLKSGQFSRENIKIVSEIYIGGNRKIHLSPSDTKVYILGEKALEFMNIEDSKLALAAGMSSLLRIGTIFAERIDDTPFKIKLEEMFQELEKMG